jgi:hypothetical protein
LNDEIRRLTGEVASFARENKGLRGENAELRNRLRTPGSQREANFDTDVDSRMLGNTGAQGNSQAFVVHQHDLPQVQEMQDNSQPVHEQLVEQQLVAQLLAEQLQAEERLAEQRLAEPQLAEL